MHEAKVGHIRYKWWWGGVGLRKKYFGGRKVVWELFPCMWGGGHRHRRMCGSSVTLLETNLLKRIIFFSLITIDIFGFSFLISF